MALRWAKSDTRQQTIHQALSCCLALMSLMVVVHNVSHAIPWQACACAVDSLLGAEEPTSRPNDIPLR